MKYKSLAITLFASSIFLSTIICIWTVIATLQGLNFTTLNFNFNLILSLGLSIVSIFIGNKLNSLVKIFILSISFTVLYSLLSDSTPLWFSIGLFLLILFFTNKLKKYDLKYLNQDFISEKIVFEFLSLFAIIFFALVILFPFYIMFVTSFKTQTALLINPLDLSIDFSKDIFEIFKSYYVIFKTYYISNKIRHQRKQKLFDSRLRLDTLEKSLQVLTLILQKVNLLRLLFLIQCTKLRCSLLDHFNFVLQIRDLILQGNFLGLKFSSLTLQRTHSVIALKLFAHTERDAAVVQRLVSIYCHTNLISRSHQQESSLRTFDRDMSNKLIKCLRVDIFSDRTNSARSSLTLT